MKRASGSFAERYGPWAVVAGASEGLGAAFATELARRGLHVVLVARRRAPLDALADRLRSECRVETLTLALDLADANSVDALEQGIGDRNIGLLVMNAAYVPIGPFGDVAEDHLAQAVSVNCSTTVRLTRRLLPRMAERGSGGCVVVSSLAGLQGSPMLTTYAATKAFGLTLAEGLWHEFAPRGVHVVGCAAGAIGAPKLDAVKQRRAPGTMSPEAVARITVDSLGRGPRVVPGFTNRIAAVVMGRCLPRALAVRLMARNTVDLRSADPPA